MNNLLPDSLFLTILRGGLHESDIYLDGEISAGEWKEMLIYAKEQSVTGIFSRGVEHLPLGFDVPDAVTFQLMAATEVIERRNRQIEEVQHILNDLYIPEGLHPVIMKGSEVARFYRFPLLRQSGDIDLFFPRHEFKRALVLSRMKLDDGGGRPDGSHHFNVEGIDIDLHDRYFHLRGRRRNLPDIPSAEATLLMLSAHILKHAMGPGIGLRQLCDMAMAFEALDGKYDKPRFRKLLKENHLLKWNALLSAFLEQYLGVEGRFLPDTRRRNPAPLAKIIMEGGNFGHFSNISQSSGGDGPLSRKGGTLRSFLSHLPFSLRYAPGELFREIFALAKGNIFQLFR